MAEVKTLNINLDSIDKIFHVSDIHIRNFKRQQEYRRVFKSLVKSIKEHKTKNSIIAVTGDIVHSKNDITPELVQEVTHFLSSLSSVLPVLVFPGNHDANLNNPHRLDTLSPIISAMKDSNVFYIKDSGIFKIADLHLCHWSVFDSRDNYIPAEDFEADYKIAVYHAPVNSATTDSNFELGGNQVSVSNFYGYDLVFLGDIHKFQYLNEDKTIAYPGSLIQQSHSESLEHGYLVWDIKNKSSEFIIVPNDTAFYTIDVENGVYSDIPDSLPNKLYLRVRYKNTNQSTIKDLLSDIKKSRDVIEVTYQKVNSFSIFDPNKEHDSVISNVRDIQYQNSLVTDYLKDVDSIDKSDIQKVCEVNELLNNELVKSEVSRNIYWTPKTFSFSNMFSYGKDNFIDFNNLEGTYGVFGQNAHGKSSLFEAIVYCIFDKCKKTSKASQVMNNKCNDFNCKLEFELNGLLYTIERKAKRLKSEHVKLDVDFYYLEGDQKISLNGKDRYDTDQNIRNILGTYEDFILTSMSLQDNNTGFIDMGQSDRKNLLSQFLDISIFDQLYTIANDKVKEYSILIKEYKKVDYDSDILICNQTIAQNKKAYRQIQSERSKLDNKIEKNDKIISTLRESLIPISEKITDINELTNKKSSVESKLDNIEQQISNLKTDLFKCKNNIIKNTGKISEYNEEELSNKIIELDNSIKQKQALVTESEKLKISMTNKLEKMKKLECLEYDENCHYCMNNVFVKDAIETKKSIKDEEDSIRTLIQNIKSLNSTIQDLRQYEDKNKELSVLKNTMQNLLNEKQLIESKIDKNTIELHKVKNELKDVNELIKAFHKNEKTIKNNTEIKLKISELDEVAKELKKELNSNQNDLIENISDTQFYEKKIAELSANKQKLESLEDRFKYYEYYIMCMNKDGIPYRLISSIIPRIESDVNNILSQIVDFQMSIKSDGKNINAYIVYDDSRFWPIELSSGMEKFVSSIALRTALINISSLPRPNFLAIDEGFGALDQENRGNISVLMEYLKTQFKFIIMISHIDSIKDVVDKQIEIFKSRNGFSKVNYS